MTEKLATQLETRLCRYVQVDTESDESSSTQPSTRKQFDLLHMLVDELKEIGIVDIELKEYGAVIATIPATIDIDAPTIAFFAHVDTTEAFAGQGVKPRVHRDYDGSVITFPDNPRLTLSPEDFPYLATKKGEDIITASGATLLGADDKAGVAIIVTLAEALLASDRPHGTIKFVFTTDEEIGRGVPEQLPADVGADVGYTLDGANRGEVVYETFSADKAVVTIEGVSTHPGDAKDEMVNAIHLASKILMMLPQVTRTPETTNGREGFIHVYGMEGGAAKAQLDFILRDFEQEGMEAHGALLRQVCDTVQATEPRSTINCEISTQYRNMRYWLEHDMRPVEIANEAARAIGIEPFAEPVRGGTDGSRLTEMGLPTPNLFTGMQNFHGPLEWVSVQDMVKATELCLEISAMWASESNADSSS